MITLYHCADARSFRPLWALEELGLDYDLRMLPFPPRFLKKEYLQENPLGTILPTVNQLRNVGIPLAVLAVFLALAVGVVVAAVRRFRGTRRTL